ncbi:hypothetical protein [Streptomyces sp. NBC_01716]|uniref:hypothetical protein n=1 Tax=Streptomyces sp. NBC_01716 TaxID=2975917 RepID=UPI002E331A4D|nr:hypothetical protein [Streptomyces sp. NBC_01716]
MTNEIGPTEPEPVESALPDLARPDAGLILMSQWQTDGPERQRTVMAGVMDVWREADLPVAYLARHCLAGSDGRTILNYAQWATSEGHRAFAADPRNQRTVARGVEALISAGPPGRFTLHRSVVLDPGAVARSFGAISYDTGGLAESRALVRELAERTAAAPASGTLIAEHLHISEDGARVRVLSAYEDDGDDAGDISGLRFRPFRGLVRPRRDLEDTTDPRACLRSPVWPTTPGTHARRVVGVIQVRPVRG